jgi:hypothetical protein
MKKWQVIESTMPRYQLEPQPQIPGLDSASPDLETLNFQHYLHRSLKFRHACLVMFAASFIRMVHLYLECL